MTEGVKLIKIGFDHTENRSPEIEETIAIFINDSEKGYMIKLTEYFLTKEPEKRYLGYNGEVYPKYKLEKVRIV
jgi:hypothetical protein